MPKSEIDSDGSDEEGNETMAKAAAKAKTVAKKKAPMKKPGAKKRTAKG